MVVQNPQKFFLNLIHHPVCAIKGSFALSSYWRSHPSWPGGAIAVRQVCCRVGCGGELLASFCSFFRFPLQRNNSRRPSP